MPKLKKYEASRNRVYLVYQRRAKTTGIEFELTKAQFTRICEKPCHYCGAEPTPSREKIHDQLHGKWKYNGLDRIDNSKGYLLSNVQACCYACNQLKSNKSEEEFLSQILAIAFYMGLGFTEEE